MVTRLVLGYSAVGRVLLERATEWSGDLEVVTDDQSRVSTLREENVPARRADPTDPACYPERADTVIVAGNDPDQNVAAARAARKQFPAAMVVAYAGRNAPRERVEELRAVADRVIDPVADVSDRFIDVVAGDGGSHVKRLFAVLRGIEGRLAVVTHDNPDPDAIASALALAHLAGSVGVDADPCYHGEISHQENRALVNLLDIPMHDMDGRSIEEYDAVALVDHSRPGVNDSLPPETSVDIVVDHHPPREPVEARYVDLRSEVGATSTLLAGYYERLGLTPSRQVATALVYGIRIDTKEFTREVSETDFAAAAYLLPHTDTNVLGRVENPTMSAEVLDILARAIRDRDVRGSALASCVGAINDRDALAQAAERLLDMEGIHTTVVYGFTNGTVYVSGRTRGGEVDLGETLREALGQIGSAGGHADMAGAQIPLGILGDVGGDSRETLSDIVEEVVSGRVFETLEIAPRAPRSEAGLALEYDGEGS